MAAFAANFTLVEQNRYLLLAFFWQSSMPTSRHYVLQFWKMATVKFAVIDVNDFLSRKQAAEPDIATDWARLEELYNKK